MKLFHKMTAIILALSTCLLSACSDQSNHTARYRDNPITRNVFAMNTYNTFTVYDDISGDVLESAENQLKALESLWSVTDEQSEIYAINHGGGQSITVSDRTAELLRFSLEMAKRTDGNLDITIYPLLTAWGFTTDNKQVPTDEQIAALMQYVGYDKIFLSENTVTLLPGMEIDLGAVAKGYACDLVAENLQANGVTSAIVSLGGNIRVIGSKPDGSDWKISVEHPENRNSLGLLSLSDVSVVTSGAYERYFEDESGKRYGHILDPSTGKPAQSGLASVTVVGKESKVCDALATAFFVMGLPAAEEYFREYGDIDFLLLTENGEIYLTNGLKDKFTLSEAYKNMVVNVIGQ